MDISSVLEVAVGMFILFYALSLMVNIILLMIKDLFDLRAENLEAILWQRLGGKASWLNSCEGPNKIRANLWSLVGRIELVDKVEEPLAEELSSFYRALGNSTWFKNLRPASRGWLPKRNRDDPKPAQIPEDSFTLAVLETLTSRELILGGAVEGLESLLSLIPARQLSNSSRDELRTILADVDANDFADRLQQHAHSLVGKIKDDAQRAGFQSWIDVILGEPSEQYRAVRLGIQALPDGDVKATLSSLVRLGASDVDRLRKGMHTWYDDLMAAAREEFKRLNRTWAMILAFVVTIVLGVDSIAISRSLWEHPAQRAELTGAYDEIRESIAGAESASDQDIVESLRGHGDEIRTLVSTVEGTGIPFTWWNLPKAKGWDVVWRIVGLLVTAVATAQGSSFWYDILRKLNPRSATRLPDAEEAQAAG